MKNKNQRNQTIRLGKRSVRDFIERPKVKKNTLSDIR